MNSTDNNQKPLLLLDIDGVLNLFDAWVEVGIPWYDTKGRRRCRTVAPSHLREGQAMNYALLLHPEHPEWIEELEDEFEIRWATMWMAHAWVFGVEAGFGIDWDHIDFDSYRPEPNPAQKRIGNGVGNYKHPGILATIGNRPAIWVDDDMTPGQHEFARRRNEAGIPTLFIQPDPEFGMTREHVDQILEFARELQLSQTAA